MELTHLHPLRMQAGSYHEHPHLKALTFTHTLRSIAMACCASASMARSRGLAPIMSRDRIASAAHTIRLLTACRGAADLTRTHVHACRLSS